MRLFGAVIRKDRLRFWSEFLVARRRCRFTILWWCSWTTAFLIEESEFAATFARIRDEGLRYWADPAKSRPSEINHHDGGSGVYFEDLDSQLLEVITRPYGGG
jgi:hypothetical protein